MMTPDERRRFDMLRLGPCVPLIYVKDYYGLDTWPLPETDPAAAVYGSFTKAYPQKKACPEGFVSRYEIEGFMAREEALTYKWMAAQLGMETKSLVQLLPQVKEFGMLPEGYKIGSMFLRNSFQEDLRRHIRGLRLLVYKDHTRYCEHLHGRIKEDLGFEVARLYCATSVQLGGNRLFAAHFDCLTLQPLSIRHSMWLNFGKPLNSQPDRCSKLFLAENKDILGPYAPGTHDETILLEYEQHLARLPHAA
ncbi:MAG: hypothetical protein NTX50_20190 [Candidatus Sumerlaeota bacterium]|nr:hypothetical protein [Candidatus Sumerlaeota bacterium]